MIKKFTPYILILPFFLLIMIFILGLINGIIQSFGYIPAFGLNIPTLKYYKDVFSDSNLLKSIFISLKIASISSVVAVVIGTAICYFLVSDKKQNKFVLNLIKIPVVIPHMIVAMFVIILFSGTGIISRILFDLGIITSDNDFPNVIYNSNGLGVILAYLWKEIPFVCYFVYAIMSSISMTLGECGENLGGTKLKVFMNITLPLCFKTIVNVFFIILTFSFGAYELPFLLGATSPKSLPVQAYIQFIHPDLAHRPYAMVLNSVIILVTLAIAMVYYKFILKRSYENE